MPHHTFTSFDLRTTDIGRTAEFYSSVLGWEIFHANGTARVDPGSGPAARIVRLPERARSLGAPCHWLGRIALDDPSAACEAFVERGGRMLSPLGTGGSGGVVRDPGGAVVAIASHEPDTGPSGVTWHELHTPDPDGVWSVYRDIFGWSEVDRLKLGGEIGTYRTFAWEAGGTRVGGLSDIRRRPQVHPHWLFYFPVVDLDRAVEALRATGGSLLGEPRTGATEARIAVAHDPLNAVFGLAEHGGGSETRSASDPDGSGLEIAE